MAEKELSKIKWCYRGNTVCKKNACELYIEHSQMCSFKSIAIDLEGLTKAVWER